VNETAVPKPMSRRRRAIYVVMPLILLLLCLASINLAAWWQAAETEASLMTTESEEPKGTPPPTAVSALATLPPTLSTPTPTFSPTPSPTLSPSLPSDAVIHLLGPPNGTVLNATVPLTLYAVWSPPLTEDQTLVLYVQANGEETPVGALSEANMGQSYRWQIQPDQWATLGTEVSWQVRLERVTTGDVLLSSEQRQFRLLPGS
jgi:hypothetical protein